MRLLRHKQRAITGLSPHLNNPNYLIGPKPSGLPIDTFYHWDGDAPETMWEDKTTWPAYPSNPIEGIDGEAIWSWGQRTANHRRLAENNAASTRPSYRLNGPNGRSYVEFDGANNYMLCGAGGGMSINTNSYTIFAVLRLRTDVVFQGIVSMASVDDFLDGMYICENSPSDGTIIARNNLDHPVCQTPDLLNQWVILEFTFDDSGVGRLRVNDNSPIVQVGSPGSIDPDWLSVGARYYGGSAGDNPAALDLAELAIYETFLSAANRDVIRNYLNNKWDIY